MNWTFCRNLLSIGLAIMLVDLIYSHLDVAPLRSMSKMVMANALIYTYFFV